MIQGAANQAPKLIQKFPGHLTARQQLAHFPCARRLTGAFDLLEHYVETLLNHVGNNRLRHQIAAFRQTSCGLFRTEVIDTITLQAPKRNPGHRPQRFRAYRTAALPSRSALAWSWP